MKVEAVLFDVGNVLIQWDPRHLYRKLLPSEPEVERFLAEVCTLDWHLAHDAGVSFEENAALLKARHPHHAALIDDWGRRYLEMSPGAVEGMEALVQGLEDAGVPLHGLTNMPSSVFPMLKEAFPVMNRLKTVVVSGDEKVCKPDPRIYELALSSMGTEPSRSLFIDDSVRNVEAAAALGFEVHHFRDARGLEADLARLGLL
ncbi:MAG: HAD family phosphatase [Parvibaculaceae bacterium]